MGVTNLWNILAPVKHHTPLSALHGQTVAVDLSIWVCENQCVKSMQGVVSRPYLRNLFFRVSHLTQLGVRLVFVIEGAAPQLKWGEMKRRQQALGRGGAQAGKGGRGNFNSKLRECCQLLDMLGVPYIHSRGEAEAMCAALNAAGLVDACITDDGDAFLYGARTVYRNFTMNNKDPHVESYSMDAIEEDLGISRKTLVGVALLLGCDYLPGGVPGVGVDRVIKYLNSIKGVDLLQRFKQWQSMSPAECVSKIENHILQKALAVADFPQRNIISEFLSEQETVPKKSFVWRRPQLVMIQDFAETKMEWVYDYTTEKILPLVTFWELSNPGTKSSQCLEPHRIVKSRVRQGVPVYEVEWYKQGDDTRTSSEFYTTMEDQTLFSQIFPQFVSQWEEEVTAKKTKKKTTSRKTKKNIEEDNLASQLETLNLENRQERTSVSQTGEEELDGKSRRKVSHRKKAANLETEVLARAAQLSSNYQHDVYSNTVVSDENRRKPIQKQEITVSGTMKTKLKKQNQEAHHFEAHGSSIPLSEAQHLSFGVDDNCFGQDNTLLSALPEIENSRLDSSDHRLTEDRSEELDTVTKDSHAPSVGSPTGESRDVESDSDKENDDVFLTLTQRLQMKLGQTTKSKFISNGFEACLALKKTQTMTRSESSFQRRKDRKAIGAVHEEPDTPADVLLKPSLKEDNLKIKPEAPSVPERRLQGKKGRNVREREDLNTLKDEISPHNYMPSNSTHKVPKRIPETIGSGQEPNMQLSVPNAKDHDTIYVSETDPSIYVEASFTEEVLCEGMIKDSLQDTLPINSKASVISNKLLSFNSKEALSLLSSTAMTKDFTCITHMQTVVDTPEVLRKTALLCQDETFGLKELHEDFRTAYSELDNKQIGSSSSGYCKLVNRLKEKLEQPLEPRNDVQATSSLQKEMNLSSSELLQSPSFLCSQTILSGNDECFLQPEARIQHQIPAIVRCTRSDSDRETSQHLVSPASSLQSMEQVTSSRTRSATLQEKISRDTISMDMTTMMENITSIQRNTNMLQDSTLLQEHDTLLQGDTKLIQDNNTVLQASTMLQGEGTLPHNTSSVSHTLTDATLQFGHFSMQASLLNDSPVNMSCVSMLGGKSTPMSEAVDDAAKTVLMSETGNVLTCDRTSILMSETLGPFERTVDCISETREVFTENNPSTMWLSKSSGLRPDGASALCSQTVQNLELEESSCLNNPTQSPNPCETECKRILSLSPGPLKDVQPEHSNSRGPVLVDESVLPETVHADQYTVFHRNLRRNEEVSVDNLNLSLASMSLQSKKVQEDLDSADLESSGNGSYVFSTVVSSNVPDDNAQNCEDFGHQRTGTGIHRAEDGKRTRCKSERRSKLSLRKSSSNLSLEKSSVTSNSRTDESPGSGCPAEHPPGRTNKKEDLSDRPSSPRDSRTDVANWPGQPPEHLVSGRASSREDNSEILLSSKLTVPMKSDVIDLTSGSPNTAEELTLKRPELSAPNNENSSSVCMSRNIFRDPNAKAVYPKPRTRIKSWTSKKQALFRLLEEMSDSDTDSEMGGFSKTSKPNQAIGFHTKQPSRNEYRPTAEDFKTLQRQGYIKPLEPLDNCSEKSVANQYKGNVGCFTRKKPQNNMVPNSGTNGNIKGEDQETKAKMGSKRNVGTSSSFSSNSTPASNLDSTSSKKASSNSTSSSTLSSLSTSNSDLTSSKSSSNSPPSKSVFAIGTDSSLDSTSNKHKTSRSDPVGEESVLDKTAHESPISLTDRLRNRLTNNARAALKTLSSQRKVLSSVNIKPINK